MADIQRVIERIGSLPAERQQAAARLFTERGSEFGLFPLSAAQRRLWFLSTLYAGVPLYNVGYGFRIRGQLDVDLLRRALDGLAARHEALRTAFFDVDGEPFQFVTDEARLTTTVTRWGGQGRVEDIQRRLLDAEARRPFDLSRAPLARSTVVRLGAEDFLFLLTLHHIVCDGWSMTIILSELAECYAAAAGGRAPALPPLSCRYVDYARWEAGQDGSVAWQRQLSYWTSQLAGAPQVLELPADHPRPPTRSWDGGQEEFRWSRAFGDALDVFCQREGVTLFVVTLAALYAVLYRWTGQEDILVGVPVANRSRLEFEGVVGIFINTVVLRARPTAATTFRALMRSLLETSMAAVASQELPFEKLVEALAPERSQNRSPLFQVCFAIQDPESIVLALPGLSTEYVQGKTGTAKFDVTLSLWPGAQGLSGSCEYNRALFEPATPRLLADNIRELLAAAMADPERHLAELPSALDHRDPAGEVASSWTDRSRRTAR